MKTKLQQLAIINEYLYSLLPDNFNSKTTLKTWLENSPYSPYITLYGGENAENFDSTNSFVSPVDNKRRFRLNDLVSFKFENLINYDNNIYSGNSRLYNLINANQLFNNYPEFKNIELNINISNAANGYMSGSTYHENGEANRIEIYASSNEDAMRVLVHELQHCIQLKEGFEIGESYYQTEGVMDMFVGSVPNEQGEYELGSFSDIAIKRTMREITDENINIDNTPYLTLANSLNKKIENKIDNLYKKFEDGEISFEEYTDLENKHLDEMLSSRITGTFKLERILSHNLLFEIYPQLKDINIEFTDKIAGIAKGAFNSNKNHIMINNKYNLEDMCSSLFHEIQHVIQDIENWAKGGNIKDFEHNLDENTIDLMLKNLGEAIFLKEFAEKYNCEIENIKFKEDTYGYDVLQNKNAIRIAKNNSLEWMKREYENYSTDAVVKYKSLWGEQLSRATQYRMNMSPGDRIKESWTETLEKVEGKYNEPIIKYQTSVSMCIDKKSREENFKNWFSDSKVIDENGEPLVVYHGTNALFDTFSNDKINKTNGMEYGVGFYFTTDISYAKQFGNVKEFYISSKKPFRLADGKGLVSSVESQIGFSNKEYSEMKSGGKYKEREIATRVLKNNGYDSVISENEISVFEPTQIKSIHNKGTFDPNNPNILEKNDYGMKYLDKVISIIPNNMDMKEVEKYLEFNGIKETHLENTKYVNILQKSYFDNTIININKEIVTTSSYWKNKGEIESREIEELYKNQDLNEAIKLIGEFDKKRLKQELKL